MWVLCMHVYILLDYDVESKFACGAINVLVYYTLMRFFCVPVGCSGHHLLYIGRSRHCPRAE